MRHPPACDAKPHTLRAVKKLWLFIGRNGPRTDKGTTRKPGREKPPELEGRRVEIRNMDAIEFIHAYDHPRALFYLDPPYLHETRSSTGEYGAHEMRPDQHTDLLTCLAGISGSFMLSGYHSNLYDRWADGHGWNRHEKRIDNKASSAKTKAVKTECCWTNY